MATAYKLGAKPARRVLSSAVVWLLVVASCGQALGVEVDGDSDGTVEPDCLAWNAARSAPEDGLDVGIGTIVVDYFGNCAGDLGPTEGRDGVELHYSRWSVVTDFLERREEDNTEGILFVMENGELFGALWWIAPDEVAPWSATFEVRGGEAVVESSLGHGLTETDDWDPAIILDLWADNRPFYEELREADDG